MNPEDLNEFKAEFDKFVQEKCSFNPEEEHNPEEGDAADNEPVPAFVEELSEKLLAPVKSGVYLSRLDLKRIAEGMGESLPIKERKHMIKALFRHTTTKAYLRKAFDEFNKHINGRILIYAELAEAFPASKTVFDEYTAKAKKTQKMFEQIIDDFEEIDPTFDPMAI